MSLAEGNNKNYAGERLPQCVGEKKMRIRARDFNELSIKTFSAVNSAE